jgi:hypothetical protein
VSFNSESLPIELDGVSYLLDTTQYRRTTVPVSRQQRDNSREAGENTLDTTGAWVRSQTDWSHGAGQLYLDNEDSDRRRFYSSQGIDVWTKGQITLLPITQTPSGTNTPTFTTGEIIVEAVTNSSGVEYLYVAQANKLFWTANPEGSSPTWNASAGITVGGTVTSLTSDGTNVYIGFDGSIVAEQTVIGSGTTSAFGSLDPNLIKIVSGRVIAADDNAIYELDAAGAKASSSLDYSLPLTSSKWVSVTSGASGIFAAANTDNTGSIYYIGVNNSDGTLNVPIMSASVPRNETINEIMAYGGVLGVATSLGFRLGLIDQQSNSIILGPVIDTGGAAYSLEADNKFMWWGTDYGTCYRADLSTFTNTLVPAYASDLVSAESATASDLTKSLARINNSGNPKLFMGIKSSGDAVLQREHYNNERVASGTLIAGEITWSTVVPKLLRSGVIDLDRSQFENLKTDYRASDTDYASDITYTLGPETTTPVGSITLTAKNGANTAATIPSSGSLKTGIPQTFSFSDNIDTAVSYDLTVTISRSGSDATKAPVCHDWQLTAVAVPRRIDEIILPIVLRRNVLTARNSGAPVRLAAGASFTKLRSLMEAGKALSYKEGDRSENVTIERLEMQPERLSDDGSWWEGTLVARLLTVPT